MKVEEFTPIADSFGEQAVWYHFEVSLPPPPPPLVLTMNTVF